MKSFSYFASALILLVFAIAAVHSEDALKDPDKKDAPTADSEEGKLLSQLLAPKPYREPLPLRNLSDRPLPPSLFPLDTPFEIANVKAARCPAPTQMGSRPMPLAESIPLDFAGLIIAAPEQIALPVGELTKIDAVDVKPPTSLPTLARPSLDRASLEDPTTEFTAQSIVKNKLPERSIQAPFVRVNLPDPFENVEAAKVKIIIKEDPLTAIGNPPAPKP